MKSHILIIIIMGFSPLSALHARQANIPAAQQTSPPAATPAPPPSSTPKLSAAELEKLVMPIALHPDPLISIILPASVYPLEIVQAARFVKDTNNIPKVDSQAWDENVKAVAKFPELIAKMDADLQWTVLLGQAFLDQPQELMDTIQSLRAKAQKAGTLQSSPQQVVTVTNVVVMQTNMTQVVTVTNQIVQVQPASPDVIYVPSYPATVYYPPPAYVYNPYAPLVTFGIGMAWGAIIANNCDWHHGCVNVDVDRNVNRNVDRNVNRDRNVNQGNRASNTGARASQQKWQPDQNRLRNSGAAGSAGTMEARGWGSGTRASTQPGAGARPSTGAAGSRPSTGTVGQRPSTGTAGNRPSTGTAGSRPSTGTASGNRAGTTSTWGGGGAGSSAGARAGSSASVNRSSGSSGSAFSGMSSGSNSRSYSNRGASSRGYSGGGGRAGGGGRGGGRGR